MSTKFCDDCEVSMDLHDEPDDCEGAMQRADRAEDLTRLMFDGFVR